jgi:hypothetical protein
LNSISATGIVSTFGEPAALVVAAAEVHGDVQRRRVVRKRRADESRKHLVQAAGIYRARARFDAPPRIAIERQRHLVELDVAATRIGERAELAAIRFDDVLAQPIGVRIGARVEVSGVRRARNRR